MNIKGGRTMKRVNLNIDEKMLNQVKEQAAELGINVSSYIRLAVAEKLRKEKSEKK